MRKFLKRLTLSLTMRPQLSLTKRTATQHMQSTRSPRLHLSSTHYNHNNLITRALDELSRD